MPANHSVKTLSEKLMMLYMNGVEKEIFALYRLYLIELGRLFYGLCAKNYQTE